MLILLSPAKTLDFEKKSPITENTQPIFIDKAKELITILRHLSPEELQSLMKINSELALLNYHRFKNWQANPTSELGRQALLAFRGEVYRGLKAEEWKQKNFSFAQSHLRILSALYGVLRPLDLISPFRLEMGCRLEINEGENLYKFWRESITKNINQTIENQGDNILINLASNEYFKAINTRLLNVKIITPIFKDFKNGAYKNISVYSKKARGMMSRFIIEQELKNSEDIKYFEQEGYCYNDRLSNKEEWFFTRE